MWIETNPIHTESDGARLAQLSTLLNRLFVPCAALGAISQHLQIKGAETTPEKLACRNS
jgi:hypothetical protein